MDREIASNDLIDKAIEEFIAMLEQRLTEKGEGTFVSAHESLGVVQEEHQEVIDAVKSNDTDQISKEMLDLAIAAFWGYVSEKQKYKGE